MSEKPTVKIGLPTDHITMSVEIDDSKCDILVVELKTGDFLVVTASVDCGSMLQDLGWSVDCFDHSTALTIVQAAVFTHYTKAGWGFFMGSQTVADTSNNSNYLVTFTFVRCRN